MLAKCISILVLASFFGASAPRSHAPASRNQPVPLAADKAKGDPIDVHELPKAVVDAVAKEFPGARLTKAVKQPDGNYFLTDVKVGKREYSLTVSPEGKILKKDDDSD